MGWRGRSTGISIGSCFEVPRVHSLPGCRGRSYNMLEKTIVTFRLPRIRSKAERAGLSPYLRSEPWPFFPLAFAKLATAFEPRWTSINKHRSSPSTPLAEKGRVRRLALEARGNKADVVHSQPMSSNRSSTPTNALRPDEMTTTDFLCTGQRPTTAFR